MLSDNVKAKEDIWFIGDVFIKDSIDALFALKKAAIVKKQPPPCIFQWFNVNGLHVSANCAIKSASRFINPLVHALNEEPHLPKYIVIVPDKDILYFLNGKNNTSAMAIGSYLHYTIKQIDMYIDRRKTDLCDKKPGAVDPDHTIPKIVWVRMLQRPASNRKELYLLRGKSNSILEERLFDGNAESHFILSIEVQERHFDFTGDLTATGKAEFWKEVNRGLQKFDKKEITLKPRSSHNSKDLLKHPTEMTAWKEDNKNHGGTSQTTRRSAERRFHSGHHHRHQHHRNGVDSHKRERSHERHHRSHSSNSHHRSSRY